MRTSPGLGVLRGKGGLSEWREGNSLPELHPAVCCGPRFGERGGWCPPRLKTILVVGLPRRVQIQIQATGLQATKQITWWAPSHPLGDLAFLCLGASIYNPLTVKLSAGDLSTAHCLLTQRSPDGVIHSISRLPRTQQAKIDRSPSSALLPLFGEGSPKVGALILPTLLEDSRTMASLTSQPTLAGHRLQDPGHLARGWHGSCGANGGGAAAKLRLHAAAGLSGALWVLRPGGSWATGEWQFAGAGVEGRTGVLCWTLYLKGATKFEGSAGRRGRGQRFGSVGQSIGEGRTPFILRAFVLRRWRRGQLRGRSYL